MRFIRRHLRRIFFEILAATPSLTGWRYLFQATRSRGKKLLQLLAHCSLELFRGRTDELLTIQP